MKFSPRSSALAAVALATALIAVLGAIELADARVTSGGVHHARPRPRAPARPAHPGSAHPNAVPIFNNFNIVVKGGANGGGACAACTLIVGLIEQLIQVHNATFDEEMEKICQLVPTYRAICAELFKLFGPEIIRLIEAKETADVICNTIKVCEAQTAVCRLFPPSKDELLRAAASRRHASDPLAFAETVRRARERVVAPLHADPRKFNICEILPQVCAVEQHLPAFDSDGDKFSTWKTLRGSYWRGHDCNDSDNNVHPGRNTADATDDTNCNGIFGTSNETRLPFEEMWCNSSNAMGLAILGDSATAHFRIPPQWLTATQINADTYKGLLRDLENELDWPMFSWSTGHMKTTDFHPDISGPVNSMYMELRRRNLCNNNDFQNLGVNGAKSTNLLNFAKLLGRVRHAPGDTAVRNKPLMLFMAMIGNDVCGHQHGFSSMTSAQVYKKAVMDAVLYADSILEPGSVIALVGLADGRILYDAMHARIHPIGSTNKDVTYEQLYDFLNCLEISPCWGWMNSNETVRNMTSAHAALLSAQLPAVAEESRGQLRNSRVIVINDWTSALENSPYPQWELIEPTDGFHPSQLGNFLLAEFMINATRDAGVLPPENPNNENIAKQFGL